MTVHLTTDIDERQPHQAKAEHESNLDPEDFKAVFRNHPGGVAVITMAGPEGPMGFTATSVSSVSADPAILVFSVAGGTSARKVIEMVDSVAIIFLADDQREIADTFAQRGIDRFSQVEWHALPTGEPIIDGSAAWIRGPIDQRMPVGDSLLVTVRASQAERRDGSHPLLYVDRTYHQLGSAISED